MYESLVCLSYPNGETITCVVPGVAVQGQRFRHAGSAAIGYVLTILAIRRVEV